MNNLRIEINSLRDAAQGKKLFEEIKESCEVSLYGLGILEGGMASGKTSCMIIFKDGSGNYMLAQLSADMLTMMYAAVQGARQRFKS